ncbi:unnamed protein product [Hermetia illucens]|uniref:Protein TsetseEP domain-containing protein n=1 Tax=Hermetia illucens TaxID=343691 RepID=A0A7R8UMY5_HERIL|nr:uncharacterized protein LOC119652862 [Hermetia illucens]CAD7083848.1 unnamed protein product [Hermetia illucens]
MKLILLFLFWGICAQLALSDAQSIERRPRQFIEYKLTPDSRNSFLEHFQTFIENIIEDATNFIKEFADKTAEIMAQIQSQIEGIAAVAQDTMNKLTKDVQDLVDAWNKEGELAQNCTMVYAPLIEEAVNISTQAFQACIQNATEAANEIGNAIRPNIGELLTCVKELQGLVDECFQNSSNVFEGISCVVGKGNEIKTHVLQVVMDIKTIIVTSTNKGFAIVSNTGKCLNTAVDEYQNSIASLREKLKNCVLEGFW